MAEIARYAFLCITTLTSPLLDLYRRGMSSDNENDDCECSVVRLVVGLVTGDHKAAMMALTGDRYDTPGDLELVGVMPGAVGHDRAGVLLVAKFPAHDGQPKRIEVMRVPYEPLLLALCHATRILHSHGYLERESMGPFIAGLLEQTEEEAPDGSELH